MDQYTIFCVLNDEEKNLFAVEISSSAMVYKLKEKIKEKKVNALQYVDADSLTLYQVDISVSGGYEVALVKDMIQELSNGGKKPLDSFVRLTKMYSTTPPEEKIHVIAKLPPGAASFSFQPQMSKRSISESDLESGSPRIKRPRHSGKPATSRDWCPRQDTVAAVLKLLLDYHIVQVRGTPASGKTTLLKLLYAYIEKYRPNSQVYFISSWNKTMIQHYPDWEDRQNRYLPDYSIEDGNERFFLFDEGQTSYWDNELWLTFKNHIQPGLHPTYVIVFCSYGNVNVRDPDNQTPIEFAAKVTLHRGPSQPYGLLLDSEEFNEVLRLQKPKLIMTDDLREFMYQYTKGHVGHVLAMADFLIGKREGQMLHDRKYSLQEFYADTKFYDELPRNLASHFLVRRGLPPLFESSAQEMRILLDGPIESRNCDPDIFEILRRAHKSGFIEVDEDQYFDFPSPLSRHIWSWILGPSPNYQLPYSDLFSFAKAIVTRFRPSQLSESDRRVGASHRRPPAAQYQDEFYRCAHDLTDGNVRISPEYAAAAKARPGRIDFFIPSKKWGIELTRDGGELEKHNSRFADDGAYGRWLLDSDMYDYILLDFRKDTPRKFYPGIKNLYHIVFYDDGNGFKILNNQGISQFESNLVHNH